MKERRRELQRVTLTVCAALLVLASACGGGDKPPAGSPTTIVAASPAPTTVLFTPTPAPELLPDGEEPPGRIAFVSLRDGNEEIYSINTDRSDEVNLTNNAASDFDPDWSPDGSRLAFASDRDGDLNIYTMNPDGSGVTRLTPTEDAEFTPRWSPDGKQIIYSALGQENVLWLMNSDGSSPHPLAIQAPAENVPLCGQGGFMGGWSPDGQRITFATVKSVGELIHGQICSVNLDGSDLQVLTDTPVPGLDAEAAVSADGRLVAFRSTRDPAAPDLINSEVYIMAADGSGQSNLSNSAATDIEPAFGSQPGWLAFSSDRGGNFDLYLMRLEDRALFKVTSDLGKDSSPAWLIR
jgi:Tol biopolymer transport system component